jgi:hypothetical protein
MMPGTVMLAMEVTTLSPPINSTRLVFVASKIEHVVLT